MKRVIIAFITLALIPALSAWSIYFTGKRTEEVIAAADKVIELYGGGDKEGAVREAEKLERLWAKYEKSQSSLANDCALHDISAGMARIKPSIESGNEDVEAEIRNIRRQLALIYRSELLQWDNILLFL